MDKNPTLDQLDRDGDSLLIIAINYQIPFEVKRLIESGAPTAQSDAEGNTALHHAVKLHQTEMVAWLMNAKAPANLANKAGQTPMMIAAKNNDKAIIDLLKKAAP